MYKLVISSQARRELRKIKKLYREAIIFSLEEIKEDPLVGKPLTRELTGRFSYKIGLFRIIYKVNTQNKLVQIITAGHRSTIYNSGRHERS